MYMYICTYACIYMYMYMHMYTHVCEYVYLLLPVMKDDRELKHVVAFLHNERELLPAGSQLSVAHLHHLLGIVSSSYQSLSY